MINSDCKSKSYAHLLFQKKLVITPIGPPKSPPNLASVRRHILMGMHKKFDGDVIASFGDTVWQR